MRLWLSRQFDDAAKAGDAKAFTALGYENLGKFGNDAIKNYLFACRGTLIKALEKGALPPLHPQGVGKSGPERIFLKSDSAAK